MRSLRAVLLALACAVLLAGCGGEDADRLRSDVQERADRLREQGRELRARAEALSERVADRVKTILDDLERSVPEAGPTTQAPTARGEAEPGTIEALLTDTLQSVDAYWTQTLEASGLPEPRVRYTWVPVGRVLRTGCGAPADDRAAFYCPADDTIYVSVAFATQVYRGLLRGLPGEEAGYGRAVGDFGVAYIVAHEYAHNLQSEFGSFQQASRGSSKPFELQADCMAGLWGNSVYRAGRLKPGDVREAMDTALAVGDFDYGNRNHHGTPAERRDAWVTGFRSGDPADCRPYADV
jgi:uncharacterized protein